MTSRNPPDSIFPRRQFLGTAAAAAAFTFIPRHAAARSRKIAPSDRVNIAAVGVGGMGRANLQALASQNIVALCDVDWNYVDTRFADISKQIENAQKRAQDATDAAQRERSLQQVKEWQ
jgi:tRNA A37 threonylcarbamoyladenosine dehydratase